MHSIILMNNTEAKPQDSGRRARKRMMLLVWVLVGSVYFMLISGYIGASMKDRQFSDYMTYVVDLALMEHRPAKEIRSLLLVKADELAIPLHGEQIQVDTSGRTLRVTVDYVADVRMPLLNRPVYRKKFSHDVTRTN